MHGKAATPSRDVLSSGRSIHMKSLCDTFWPHGMIRRPVSNCHRRTRTKHEPDVWGWTLSSSFATLNMCQPKESVSFFFLFRRIAARMDNVRSPIFTDSVIVDFPDVLSCALVVCYTCNMAHYSFSGVSRFRQRVLLCTIIWFIDSLLMRNCYKYVFHFSPRTLLADRNGSCGRFGVSIIADLHIFRSLCPTPTEIAASFLDAIPTASRTHSTSSKISFIFSWREFICGRLSEYSSSNHRK